MSFKASNCLWLVGVKFIFDSTPQIIVQRCQIAAPKWPKDISSAADNAIFKNTAHSAVVLKPNVANILLFNFCEQKFVQHGPITVVIDCNDLSLLIFKENWRNYASGLKSAPNSYSFCYFQKILCILGFLQMRRNVKGKTRFKKYYIGFAI